MHVVGGSVLGLVSFYGLGVASNAWITSGDEGWGPAPAVIAAVVAAALGAVAGLAPKAAVSASVAMIVAVVVCPWFRPGADLARAPLHPLDILSILGHASSSPLVICVLVLTGIAGGVRLAQARKPSTQRPHRI